MASALDAESEDGRDAIWPSWIPVKGPGARDLERARISTPHGQTAGATCESSRRVSVYCGREIHSVLQRHCNYARGVSLALYPVLE